MSVDSVIHDTWAVVFDAVGTLIEAVPSVSEVYAAAARRQGLAADPQVIKALFRRHLRADEEDDRQGTFNTDENRERARWRRIVANVLPELPDFERGFEDLWTHFGSADSWRCFADVAPILEALEQAKVPMRIASNFDARLRQVVRGLPPLAGFSERLLISSELGVRKPHPAFYSAACASLGLQPGRVLWVGDDLENDLHGPRRAGMVALFLDRQGDVPPDLPSLPSLAALLAHLGARVVPARA
jgi:putative hydrolase of the HAD superfamily